MLLLTHAVFPGVWALWAVANHVRHHCNASWNVLSDVRNQGGRLEWPERAPQGPKVKDRARYMSTPPPTPPPPTTTTHHHHQPLRLGSARLATALPCVVLSMDRRALHCP